MAPEQRNLRLADPEIPIKPEMDFSNLGENQKEFFSKVKFNLPIDGNPTFSDLSYNYKK